MKRILPFILLIGLALSAAADSGLTAILEPIRMKYGLPALGAAIFTSNGLVAESVTGVRKKGADVAASIDDLWHLGSNSKAMTAVLLGTFVAEGKLSWDDKVLSFFPSAADAAPANAFLTVRQMLAQQSGWGESQPPLPTNISLIEQRRMAAELALKTAPAYPAGHYHYSNVNYIVAGAIAEKIGGKPWEELMRERVFQPLGMTSAGFGGLGTPGEIDQPWPHLGNGTPGPVHGPAADNPAIMAPAGEVHCSLPDWVKFLTDQLRGGEGKTAVLPLAYYESAQGKIADCGSEGKFYGYGWIVAGDGDNKFVEHNGTNGTNYSFCHLKPGKDVDVGFAVCTNMGPDGPAGQAVNEALSALQKYWDSHKPPSKP